MNKEEKLTELFGEKELNKDSIMSEAKRIFEYQESVGNPYSMHVVFEFATRELEKLKQSTEIRPHETIVICPECESKDISHGANKMEVFPSGDYYRDIVFDICNDCGYAIDVEFFD